MTGADVTDVAGYEAMMPIQKEDTFDPHDVGESA